MSRNRKYSRTLCEFHSVAEKLDGDVTHVLCDKRGRFYLSNAPGHRAAYFTRALKGLQSVYPDATSCSVHLTDIATE